MPTTPRRRVSACLFLLLLSLLAVVPLTTTPASARAGAALSVSPQHYIGGQRLTFEGNIGARGERRVKLQINLSRPGDEWKDVDDFRGAMTQRDGDFSFGYTAPAMFGIRMRVASGRLSTPPITFQADSQDLVVEVLSGEPGLDPGQVLAAEPFRVEVDTTPNSDGERDLARRTDLPPPAHPGRVLTLQRRTVDQVGVPSYANQWTTVDTTTSNAQGKGVFTGVETDQDTVYRVRQEDWTEGGSKIGWYPSFPTYVDVVSGARAGSARTAAQPVAGRATAGSVPVTFKDVASTTAAETYQWRPSLWDYGWTYGESLTDGPSRGSDPVGWWVDWTDGTGRAAKHNGGVMLDTQRQNTDEQPGSRGTTAVTMRGNPMKYGRWEVRMRTKSTENHAYDPHVLIELVPDDPADYHCGAQTITVADFTPHGSDVEVGAKALAGAKKWTRTVRDAWKNGSSTAFGVEVTRGHITWFIEGRVVATVKSQAAVSDVPMTLRLSLAGRGLDEINRTQAISDWQRGYSLERGAQKTNGAPMQQGTHAGGC